MTLNGITWNMMKSDGNTRDQREYNGIRKDTMRADGTMGSDGVKMGSNGIRWDRIDCNRSRWNTMGSDVKQ